MGKFPNYVQYFDSNIVEGAAELGEGWNELGGGGWSWLEVEMSWLEVNGAGLS